jgi:mutator protein MutT
MSIIDVAAGLIFHRGQLLITQRFPEAHLGGLWEFPGGKLEANETFSECLVREIQEELAIEIEIVEQVADVTHDYPGKSVHLEFFRCSLVAGEPKAIGCAALEWIKVSDLSKYKFPPADREIVTLLETNREWWNMTA